MKLKKFNFKTVNSTNDLAIQIIKKTNNKSGIIIAEKQKKGRGQYGKKWTSFKGNLFVSIFFKINKVQLSLKDLTKVNCLLVKKLLSKFYIFKAVIEQSMYFLAIVGLLSTVVAAFYYLRIIKIIYFDKEKEKYDDDHSLWLKFSLTFSTILILLYFIFPSQLINVVSRINII